MVAPPEIGMSKNHMTIHRKSGQKFRRTIKFEKQPFDDIPRGNDHPEGSSEKSNSNNNKNKRSNNKQYKINDKSNYNNYKGITLTGSRSTNWRKKNSIRRNRSLFFFGLWLGRNNGGSDWGRLTHNWCWLVGCGRGKGNKKETGRKHC